LKKKSAKLSKQKEAAPSSGSAGLIMAAIIAICGVWAGSKWKANSAKSPVDQPYHARPKGELTFNKHIAPIVFENCSGCHRPGQSAPFSLLEFADVKKRATDIVNVTQMRVMPPWLPEPGHGEFLNERRLTAQQIGMIKQWFDEGATEGAAADLPPLPKWNTEWQLGAPDMIVTMPAAYSLAAEGRDVYRNFVIPIGALAKTQYVRGIELRPGNPKIVHHAFIKVDKTGQSARLDAQDPEVGFAGMNAPAEMPDGHFLGWQPGRLPVEMPHGLSWRLEPGSDLVLQTHLNPSGKPENLQAAIGLYFTNEAPTNKCFKMTLASFIIDIPPGQSEYVVEDDFVLPIDVQVLATFPHAHYLAKEMHGWATLPDGKKEELLLIKQWDFNWQGDYRYKNPIALPKGTKLSMRYAYDNSTNNIRNPSNPPVPVNYGAQSKDEMAELWFQMLPRDPGDMPLFHQEYNKKLARDFYEADLYSLKKNPNDAKAHVGVGQALVDQGKIVEAADHFRAAIQADPKLPAAHYHMGLLHRRQNQLPDAVREFETTVRLDPKDGKAHGNLGYVFLNLRELDLSIAHFNQALQINPNDAVAQNGLNEAMRARRQLR
jgi:hypothetical protein